MKLIGLGVRPGGATLTKGVQGLAGWVGRVGFDQAVQTLAQKTNPKTGQSFGIVAAKKIIGKLKGMANRAGLLAPEHSYDPTERAMAKGDEAHPGFATVQAQIAQRFGLGHARAGAILAAATRRASTKARQKNPRLTRVPGGPMTKAHVVGPIADCPACQKPA